MSVLILIDEWPNWRLSRADRTTSGVGAKSPRVCPMNFKATVFLTAILAAISVSICRATSYQPSKVVPPKLSREFRGLWLATVANIDWPSKPGLSTAAQKAELISILDRAAELKMNAIIFQVRPACDAFYASKIEPWSEYLTGTMGQAPSPYYDPLKFAIDEAHRRGLELHAWFNPYRALHKSHEGKVSQNHISKTHPRLVKTYGQYLWLDPGEPDVQDYSLSVVMDVVKRYDIDGVHFDDYFYPDRAESPTRAEFSDYPSWKKFGVSGKLDRDNWRRANVDSFIERVYRSIKAVKPWVKFGVSPHGIWRPGNPPQIARGFDAYATIYADSRKWLANGWVDYFSPQLYWPIAPKETSFPVLLNWWADQNIKQRHLWPGLSVANALSRNWSPDEIANQIRITRQEPHVDGYLFYNTSSLLTNKSLMGTLRRDLHLENALVPASPWLGKIIPEKPTVLITGSDQAWKLNWSSAGNKSIRWWLVQTKDLGDWQSQLLPVEQLSERLRGDPEIVSVSALDGVGNLSAPTVFQVKTAASIPRRIPRRIPR